LEKKPDAISKRRNKRRFRENRQKETGQRARENWREAAARSGHAVL